MRIDRLRLASLLAAASIGLIITTAPALAGPAMVAIIIDDLGNSLGEADRTAALPGNLTCSVLPHTPFATTAAETCRTAGKEVFVHLPMQPEDPRARPGPGVLVVGQTRDQLREILRGDLASVPGAVGVNNHMGSLLTRHIAYMDWVMSELSLGGDLVFVDSATTTGSVALRLATEYGLPTTRRDVFLDEDPSPDAIHAQWERLVGIAHAQGAALAIGHPRDATLGFLAAELETAADRDIILVSVTELIRAEQQRGQEPWPGLSSR